MRPRPRPPVPMMPRPMRSAAPRTRLYEAADSATAPAAAPRKRGRSDRLVSWRTAGVSRLVTLGLLISDPLFGGAPVSRLDHLRPRRGARDLLGEDTTVGALFARRGPPVKQN